MKRSNFNKFWNGSEVPVKGVKKQGNDFKTLWKGGADELQKATADEIRQYIQMRFDRGVPEQTAWDQAVELNDRLPETKKLGLAQIEQIVDEIYIEKKTIANEED